MAVTRAALASGVRRVSLLSLVALVLHRFPCRLWAAAGTSRRWADEARGSGRALQLAREARGGFFEQEATWHEKANDFRTKVLSTLLKGHRLGALQCLEWRPHEDMSNLEALSTYLRGKPYIAADVTYFGERDFESFGVFEPGPGGKCDVKWLGFNKEGRIQLAPNYVDIVVMQDFFETEENFREKQELLDLDRVANSLRESARVLKPGGKMAFFRIGEENLPEDAGVGLELVNEMESEGTGGLQAYVLIKEIATAVDGEETVQEKRRRLRKRRAPPAV
eukprot:TRINITY_DN29479_c0_g1_i1.p1 TRINITY_DN29479_c0_g1~~TRINITY_DN29479_c0_g1_i1.p1  ORF type:complete len:279 (-),score=62.00 TRINITY_DN29479_c0_g1_i1:74-910(-)